MDTFDWDAVIQMPADTAEDMASYMLPAQCDPSPMQMPSAHMPTPPCSDEGSPPSAMVESDSGKLTVSVSTTFFPGASILSQPQDITLMSSDYVYFYVHSDQLLCSSNNNFHSLLPCPPQPATDNTDYPVIQVPESSDVLNVILHTIYSISCAHYSPQFETLVTAARRLPHYGVSVKEHVQHSMPLYCLLLSYAPLYPIELYALASLFDLFDLAAATSSHLLSYSLPNLTDAMAEKIGPIYLKRLFFLHFGRCEALKRALLPPPHLHPPTDDCDFKDQKRLTRAWALAAAYLAWEIRPDLSTSAIESALKPLGDHLTCQLCKNTLAERVKSIIVQWSVVKRTI